MAATSLFGASRVWAGWRLQELPVRKGPGSLFIRKYAKKPVMKSSKGGKGTAAAETLKDLEVCTDPTRLTTHAMGVNIYREGQDVALKPDSEYPQWLFQMNLGPPKKLEELELEAREYWQLLRQLNIWCHNRLSKNKKL